MAQSPLIEMTLSIQFASLPQFRTPYIGLLWGEFRERYNQAVEAPPMPPAFELFGGPATTGSQQVSFKFNALIPRIIFESADETTLLHFQQDRVMLTWRRYPAEQPYPGYDVMRAHFSERIAQLAAFLSREGLGEIRPNQCELTYTNALLLQDELEVHGHLERVTPMWRDIDMGLPFDGATIQSVYIISSREEPIGRLYTNFTPAVLTATGEPNYQLEIVARCRPAHDSVEGAFETLDTAHGMVGRAFNNVTSSLIRASGGK